MDLGTINTRIREGYYLKDDPEDGGAAEFAKDVNLVWDNSLLYNKHPDNLVRKTALDFQEHWNRTWAKLDLSATAAAKPRAVAASPAAASPAAAGSPAKPKKAAAAASAAPSESAAKMKEMEAEIAALKAGGAGGAAAPKMSKAELKKLNDKKLTYKEKQQLKTDIFQLPAEQLQPVIDIISKHSPPDQVCSTLCPTCFRACFHFTDLPACLCVFRPVDRATAATKRLQSISTNCKCRLCASYRHTFGKHSPL